MMHIEKFLEEIQELNKSHNWLVKLSPYLDPECETINGKKIRDNIAATIHNHINTRRNTYFHDQTDDFIDFKNLNCIVKEIKYLQQSDVLLQELSYYFGPYNRAINGVVVDCLYDLHVEKYGFDDSE